MAELYILDNARNCIRFAARMRSALLAQLAQEGREIDAFEPAPGVRATPACPRESGGRWGFARPVGRVG